MTKPTTIVNRATKFVFTKTKWNRWTKPVVKLIWSYANCSPYNKRWNLSPIHDGALCGEFTMTESCKVHDGAWNEWFILFKMKEIEIKRDWTMHHERGHQDSRQWMKWHLNDNGWNGMDLSWIFFLFWFVVVDDGVSILARTFFLLSPHRISFITLLACTKEGERKGRWEKSLLFSSELDK